MTWKLAAVLMMLMAADPAVAEQPGFCDRMAAKFDMKPVGRSGAGEVADEWRVNVFSPMQRLLTGGSSLVSFGMRPAGDLSKVLAADYLRLQSTCTQQGKEIHCRVDQPMVLTVSAGNTKAEMEALPGERAEVGTKGSRLFCRNLRGPTTG